MLRIDNLDVKIGSRILIPKLNAHWQAGSLIAILGPNGIGKSTLLNHIAGIQLSEPGRVFLDSVDLFGMKAGNRAKRISSIAQNDTAPLDTTVFDRISHGLFPLHDDARALEIAAQLGIGELLQRPLFALSGGQRKKVHIARALVHQNADIFILDEPDASLDDKGREVVLDMLSALKRQGKLVIVSLHHRELANRYAEVTVDLANRLA